MAPWLARVLMLTAWRATQAVLAGGPRASTIVPAFGLALGEPLSLDAIANTNSRVAGVGRVVLTVLWLVVLTAATFLFARWLVVSASACRTTR